MDLIENRKGTSTQISSRTFSTEVPANFSREKAIRYLTSQADVRGADVNAVPEPSVRLLMYKLFMKIGASGEVPTEGANRDSYLNDFWGTIYLKNHRCPGDIPFAIIIDEFTTALVQGEANRKGNNQAAICQAFNAWICREDVRNRLYEIRNRRYPEHKPKEIPARATQESIRDYSDKELQSKLESIKPFEGLKTVDRMIEELEKEIERRESIDA